MNIDTAQLHYDNASPREDGYQCYYCEEYFREESSVWECSACGRWHCDCHDEKECLQIAASEMREQREGEKTARTILRALLLSIAIVAVVVPLLYFTR